MKNVLPLLRDAAVRAVVARMSGQPAPEAQESPNATLELGVAQAIANEALEIVEPVRGHAARDTFVNLVLGAAIARAHATLPELRLEKLKLEDGDTLVATVPADADEASLERLREILRCKVPASVDVLVKRECVQLEVEASNHEHLEDHAPHGARV